MLHRLTSHVRAREQARKPARQLASRRGSHLIEEGGESEPELQRCGEGHRREHARVHQPPRVRGHQRRDAPCTHATGAERGWEAHGRVEWASRMGGWVGGVSRSAGKPADIQSRTHRRCRSSKRPQVVAGSAQIQPSKTPPTSRRRHAGSETNYAAEGETRTTAHREPKLISMRDKCKIPVNLKPDL